jgi:hypothetical protein
MKKSKPRNTLAKEIRQRLKGGDDHSVNDALTIAQFGRLLTPAELLFTNYFAFKAASKVDVVDSWRAREWKLPDGSVRKMSWREANELNANLQADILCKKFVAAVEVFDFQKIHEFAEAVRFFKTNGHTHNAEPERAFLLWLKSVYHREFAKGLLLDIHTLAQMVAHMKTHKNVLSPAKMLKVETPADGFSALRRKCREVDFPLAPSKRKPARPVKSK